MAPTRAPPASTRPPCRDTGRRAPGRRSRSRRRRWGVREDTYARCRHARSMARIQRRARSKLGRACARSPASSSRYTSHPSTGTPRPTSPGQRGVHRDRPSGRVGAHVDIEWHRPLGHRQTLDTSLPPSHEHVSVGRDRLAPDHLTAVRARSRPPRRTRLGQHFVAACCTRLDREQHAHDRDHQSSAHRRGDSPTAPLRCQRSTAVAGVRRVVRQHRQGPQPRGQPGVHALDELDRGRQEIFAAPVAAGRRDHSRRAHRQPAR